MRIGRREACDVRLTHPHVSGWHCNLRWDGRHVIVEDSSTNGTFLNGKVIGKGVRAALSTGATCIGCRRTYVLADATVNTLCMPPSVRLR